MKYPVIILLSVLILSSCGRGDEMAQKEEWAGKPVSEWPELVFTNNIEFKDTTYTGIANSFLVDTGHDTLGVTCKHVFLVFRHEELLTIDLGDNFIEWRAYPKGNEDRHMVFGNMINKNSNEMVDRFNTLKVRDWLLFEVDDIPAGFTPLKIRTKPVQKDEIIYHLGWPNKQESRSPSLVKMQVFRNAGPYYYVNTLSEDVDPAGRSGSPVIDANGYLVGIVSGAEGNLGVICNVSYLDELIER